MNAETKTFVPSVEAIQELGRVALIYGGQSAERSISLKSGAAVEAAMGRMGICYEGIDLRSNLFSFLHEGQYDRVFLMLHGPGGEDGTIQGALESVGLPYTGSGVLGSALAMDKLRSKQLWRGIGLPTPEFFLLTAHSNWSEIIEVLGGQVIVKPAREGSSIGMSTARTSDELFAAYETAAAFDDCIIAERWVEGDEYTVAILNGRALPVIKLETDNLFYDFEAKYESSNTRYICPCGLSSAIETDMQYLALNAFAGLGCRGWGRVDIMRDHQGGLFLLEVNTIPGMTNHSLVPMAAQAEGIGFDDLVFRILYQTC